ncbi:MAG: helix-turn-helix domain-containing protein [Candidatus Binatus sp.]
MADKKSKSKLQAADFGANAESEQSLGQLIAETRERKGMTREQVANEAHLPPHYVKMIETDNYDLISDRLYLVPFLRRYATFLGLDAEEVASRFVSNVQHAEANVVRISQEITVVTKKPGALGRIAFAVMIAAVLVLLADFAWRRFVEHEAHLPAPVSSPAATEPEPNAQASSAALPPATIVTNPKAALPPSSPAAAPDNPRPAGVPPAVNRSVPPRPIGRPATDD